MALVPYEKEVDEYKRVFENAVGYNPMRDRPNYLAFSVQRAEVTGDPNAELQWQNVGGTRSALQLSKKWAGFGTEVVNDLYVAPNLTMPIPPILLRKFEDLASHPDLPKKNQRPASNAAPTATEEEEEVEGAEGDLPISRRSPSGGPAGGMMSSMPGMAGGGGPAGGMMSSMPGMAGGGGPAGGMMSSMPGMAGGGGGPAGGMMSSMPGMAGGGMGGMMGGGMGGDMMSSYGQQIVSEWKLVRYFDFTAEPGKVYQYRVQLLVEDPNHPQAPTEDVPSKMLEDDTAKRVASIESKLGKEGLRTTGYFMRNEWSDPSPAISLPTAGRFFAGGPVNRAPIQSDKNGAELYKNPPEAKMVGIAWDDNWGIDVSYDKEVSFGTVLNAKDDVQIVHPLTTEFKLIEKYDFRAALWSRTCAVELWWADRVPIRCCRPPSLRLLIRMAISWFERKFKTSKVTAVTRLSKTRRNPQAEWKA